MNHSKKSCLRLKRSGEISPLMILFVGSLLVVGILFYLALRLRPEVTRTTQQDEIRIYCAAGIAKPVQDVIEKYNNEFGTSISIARTGGSGELAGQIKTEFETGVKNGAELYITADQLLLEKAKSEGMVAEVFELALQRPVIAVRANETFEFDSFESLVRSEKIRFGICSPRAAVGKLVRKIAERDGFLAELESNKVTDFENVMTLAQALVTKSIDVALTWDTTVSQINQNDTSSDVLSVLFPADPQDEYKSRIAIGVVSTSTNATHCLKIARYLTAAEKSQSIFDSYGFSFLEGDSWEEVPEIHLFCGSMFTPVIEESVREFAIREGINLYPKWEGCGKLVTRMLLADKSQKFPDAYFACDEMFLEKVKQHFRKPVTVSKNDLVIAVRREAKDKIKHLEDLLQENIRVGICDPEQSALGTLTRKMLKDYPSKGFYSQLSHQAAVTADVGPTLVSQLLAGGLDAAIVYRSNINADKKVALELIVTEIDRKAPFSVATQPWAVSRTTKYPRLMKRMFEWIQRDQILDRFTESGFRLVKPTMETSTN